MQNTINTAMILAAGRGERLRPLTDTTPKPLLNAGNKKLIEYHLENLAAAGFDNVVINTAWLAKCIHQSLGDGSKYGVNIQYSNETEALETAGGIHKALPLLSDTFLVVNGDVWCDFDFAAWHNKTIESEAHLLLVNNPDHNADGDFSLNGEWLSNTNENTYTYSGIGIYKKSFFYNMATGKAALGPLLREKCHQQRITAELFLGEWTDVGTTQRLQQLNAKLSNI